MAIISRISTKEGSATFLDKATITSLFSFLAIILIPVSSISMKTTPSKLIFSILEFGGFHLTLIGLDWTRRLWDLCWNSKRREFTDSKFFIRWWTRLVVMKLVPLKPYAPSNHSKGFQGSGHLANYIEQIWEVCELWIIMTIQAKSWFPNIAKIFTVP